MVDGPHQAVGGEAFQAVVNRGQRNGGHAVFDAHEDFDGAGMVSP